MTSDSLTPKQYPVLGKLGGFGLLLLGAAAFIGSLALIRVVNRATDPTAAQAPAEQHDFHLVQLGTFRRDQFLLDKSSGRVWQGVCSGKTSGPDCNGMMIWDEMYVSGVTPKESLASLVYEMHQQSELKKASGKK